MKRWIAMALGLCLAMGLTACKNQAVPQKEQAMGRYIETTISEDLDGAHTVLSFHSKGDTTVLYATGYQGQPERLVRYILQSGQVVQSQEMPWAQKLQEQGMQLMDLSEGADGTVYLLGRGENEIKVYHTSAEGEELKEISSVTSSISQANGNFQVMENGGVQVENTAPNEILATQDGFLLFYEAQIVYYTAGGEKLKVFDGLFYPAKQETAVQGNELFLKSRQAAAIQVYNLTTGEEQSRHNLEDFGHFGILLADTEQIFLIDATGIYRQSKAGSLWEQLVDGQLTSLSMPSKYLEAAAADNAGGFYAVLSDSSAGMGLMYYSYSADTPTQPDTELTVFTLQDSNILRQAISEFQRKNPSVRVNLQVALGQENSAAAIQDIIQALNTEILSGKGPDLIVLDGLPAESYIEKGVLADLSEVVEKMEGSGLMQNLLSGYRRENGLFAVPAQFTIPVFLSQNGADPVTEFDALVQRAVKEAASVPPYLMAPSTVQEEDGSFLMEWYQRLGLPLVQNGTLDTGLLSAFFADGKALADAFAQYQESSNTTAATIVAGVLSGSGSYEIIDSAPMALKDGKAQAYAMTLTGQNNLKNLNVLEQEGIWKISSLFEKNKFIPQINVGILKNSKNQQLAQGFLQTLCGPSVQSVYLGAGFPVNQDAFQAVVQRSLARDDGSLMQLGQDFYTLCMQADTAILTDRVMENAIAAQARAVLDGSTTPEQAAKAVEQAMKLYLAE